jgi:membrane protease YdiL (CAAX protease family)
MRKEEFAGAALAILATAAWIALAIKLSALGEEWPNTLYHPAFGLPVGALALGVLVAALTKGHFGNENRNGRKVRPFVFWSGCYFFLSLGLVLMINSITFLSR